MDESWTPSAKLDEPAAHRRHVALSEEAAALQKLVRLLARQAAAQKHGKP
jgi:hypothetical protein